VSAGTARDLLDLAWIVPALPLLGALVLLFLGRRLGEPMAGWIATGLMALAFGWSIVMFAALRDLPEHAQVNVHTLFTWLPAGTLQVDFGVYTDPLSITWLLLVTGVGTLIHLYSIGYMHGDPRYSRFFCYLNLFAASMLILVLGSTFLLTFLGWEGVGLCSYLLVSFWFERNAAAVAGKKAFVTNRVGDVGFLLAMFLIFASYGTLDYAAMTTGARLISGGTATAIALLLLLAAVGKSAQIPLHVWLPDAMEGPTPVSALIHAATMVTAGVFLLCRAFPFLEASPDAATVVAWIGGVTALLAGTVAILQPDIKRVLAYSTVSQLGYMFLAVGVGAYTAAVFMVICHACYKGCLFLGAGSVIHGNHDSQDMRRMGRFRRFLPYTAMGMVVAWLAISGIPPLSGFFSKDEIITQVFLAHDYGLWLVALVAAIFTGLYMTRLIFLTFYGNARFELAAPAAAEAVPVVSGGSDDAAAPVAGDGVDSDPSPTVAFGEPIAYPDHPQAPHESPGTMTGPILLLAFLAAVIGFLNMPFHGLDFFDRWLEPSFPNVHEQEPTSFFQGATLEVLAVILAVVGITVAYRLYRRGLDSPARDPLDEKLGGIAPVLGNAYYYDAGIARLVDGPLRAFARFLDRVVDTRIIDGTVDGVGRLVRGAARGLRHVQDGFVRRYALGIAFGAVALLLYALVWVG
jgi:NADH-quinone oxidoreductase subunit L